MMRRRFCASVIALLATVLMTHVGVGSASVGGCAGATTVPVDDSTRRQATRAVICLVNRVRASHDVHSVRRSRLLGKAARFHSGDMVQRGYFGHEGPAGDTLGMRVQRTGYAPAHAGGIGEALAWGSLASPRSLMQALMQSPEHRVILLDPSARDIGLGLTLGAPTSGAMRPSSTLVLVFGE